MMILMTTLSIFTSLLFIYSSNPLGLALLIIFQSFVLSLALYFSISTSWFSFIILMIFISGMMIIFTYVAALASNDLESYSPSTLTLSLLYAAIIIMILPNSMLKPYWSNYLMTLNDWTPLINYKIYSPLIILISVLLFIYLLISMMVVIKNSALMKGPLIIK